MNANKTKFVTWALAAENNQLINHRKIPSWYMDITKILGTNSQTNNNKRDRTLDRPTNEVNKFVLGKRTEDRSKDNKWVMQANKDKEIIGKISRTNKSEVKIRHYTQEERESPLIPCKGCDMGEQ